MEGAEGLELGREVHRRIGTPRVPKSLVAGGRHQPTTETPGTPQRARFDRTLQERGRRTYTRVSPWREAARRRPRAPAAPALRGCPPPAAAAEVLGPPGEHRSGAPGSPAVPGPTGPAEGREGVRRPGGGRARALPGPRRRARAPP